MSAFDLNIEPPKGYGYIYHIASPYGQSYIGQTTHAVQKRFAQHRCSRRGCRALQEAFIQHGTESFTLHILACVPIRSLNRCEQEAIRDLNTLHPNGYNLTSGGHGNHEISAITRIRLSEAHKGQKLDATRAEALHATRRGKHHTSETRALIAKASKRYASMPEVRQRTSRRFKGKKLTVEHVAKLKLAWVRRKQNGEGLAHMRKLHQDPVLYAKRCKALTGLVRTDKHKANLSASLQIALNKPETRAKMSASAIRRFQNPEERAKVSAFHKGRKHNKRKT